MRRAYSIGAIGHLGDGLRVDHAFAQEPNDDDDADPQHDTEEPKEAEQPAQRLKPSGATRNRRSKRAAPGRRHAAAAAVAKPKFGDTTVTRLLPRRLRREQPKGSHDLLLARPARRAGLQVPARQRVRGLVRDALHDGRVRGRRRRGRARALHADRLHPDHEHRLLAERRPPRRRAVHDRRPARRLSFPNLYVDIEGHPLARRRHGLGRHPLLQARVGLHQRLLLLESVRRRRRHRGHPPRQGPAAQLRRLRRRRRAGTRRALSPAPSLPAQSDFGVRNDLQLRGHQTLRERRVPARLPVHRQLQQRSATPTAAGASPCSTCSSCSAATTSSPSSTAGAAEPASGRSLASTTPTFRFATT